MPLPFEIDYGFNFKREDLWSLPAKTEEITLSDLSNNLQIEYLDKNGTDDWNMSPEYLLKNLNTEIGHKEAMLNADLSYPIEIMFYKGDYKILDGIHRFCKAHYLNHKTIKVRKITQEQFKSIQKD